MNNSSVSLFELVNSWKDFVDDCKIGYSESIYEFDYDLQIRDELQEFISSDIFTRLDYKNEIIKKIDLIDNEFINILIFINVNDSDLPFWKRKKVLKYAKGDYVTDVLNIFGIEITLVD